MKNYALIAITLSALMMGLEGIRPAWAQDGTAAALPSSSSTPPASSAPAVAAASSTTPSSTSAGATSPGASASNNPVFVPAAGGSTGSGSSSATIVPVTPGSAFGGASGLSPSGNGLMTSPATPTTVQDAVTRLQKVDQINLDDMVRAQDAINRLDLLLEIEKRQTELKKIRDERNKPAVSATAAASLLGSAIPASALNLPKLPAPAPVTDSPSSSGSSSSFTPKPSFTAKAPKEQTGPSDKITIKRISGTDGRYFAVLNTDDNTAQTVHPGDKLPDGTLVKSISLTSVSLFKDKKSKNLTIPSDSYIVRESGTSTQ